MGVVFTETWDDSLGGSDFLNAARVTSPTLEGAGALRLQSVAQQTYWETSTVGGPQRTMVARVWVRFGVFPAADIRVIHAEGTSNDIAIGWQVSSGKFGCMVDDVFLEGVGGPTIILDKWYRIDARFDMQAYAGEIFSDGAVDGEALPQAIWGPVSGTYTAYKLGPNNTGPTMTMYFDSLQVSNTLADYPLGLPTPYHLVPRSVGA